MVNQSYRIYAPITFAVALIIGIAFVRPLYTEYMDARTEAATATRLESEKKKDLDALIALQNSFASSGSTELVEKVKKLDKKWNEAQIMSAVMLTDYTKGSAYIPAPIEISSIVLDKGKKLPSGLSLGTVTLALTGKSIDDVVSFLTYLTMNSSYVFTLDSISLPLSVPVQKDVGDIGLGVTLGVYYYE
jgi:hypothetical protein